MTRSGMGSLVLALGLLATAARAGEDGWRPVGAPPALAPAAVPAVRLDGPVPLVHPPTRAADPQVQPAAFVPNPHTLGPIFRGAAPEISLEPPRSVPGTPLMTSSVVSNSMFAWRRAPDGAAPPPDPVGPAAPASLVMPVSVPAVAPLPSLAPPVAVSVPAVAPLPAPMPTGPSGPRVPEPPLAPPVGMEPRSVPAWPVIDPAVEGGFASGPLVATGPACASCGEPACDGCGCPPRQRFYANMEYLLWWLRGQNLPPLVTTGDPTDPNPGALGQPHTQILFGNNSVNGSAYSGARLTVGYWFDDDATLGVEFGGFFLGSQSVTFNRFSLGNPLLARPFFDVNPGSLFFNQENAQVKASPVSVGGININTRTSLWGYESNLRTNLFCGPDGFIDGLVGFRALGLDDQLTIGEQTMITMGPFSGVGFNIVDSFKTSNRFYGGQVGTVAEYRVGRWSFDLTGKVGLGDTQQLVEIHGGTLINNRGLLSNFPNNGILAQPTNSGRFTRDMFTVVPEVGLSVGYQLSDHWRLGAGYNFLYWSSVARAGNQIDRVVNSGQFAPPQLPLQGPARPAFNFNGSDFWAQGLTFSLEFKY